MDELPLANVNPDVVDIVARDPGKADNVPGEKVLLFPDFCSV